MNSTGLIQMIAKNDALYAKFNTTLQTLVLENALYGASRTKPLVQKTYRLTTAVYDTLLQEDRLLVDKTVLLQHILTRVGIDVNVAKLVFPTA